MGRIGLRPHFVGPVWASLVGGLLFLLAHGGYMLFSQHRKRSRRKSIAWRPSARPAGAHSAPTSPWPDHWVMAFAMLALLFTAFLPIIGVRFAWQSGTDGGHPADGVDLFHIVHATFFLDFWSIWVGPKDIPELKTEILREMGRKISPVRGPENIRWGIVCITWR